MIRCVSFIIIFTNTCVKLPVTLIPGARNDKAALVQRIKTQIIPVNDSRCIQGGVSISSWSDVGVSDNLYTEGIDTDYNEQVVCHGTNITNNTTQPGDLKLIVTDLNTGDVDCPSGGKRYESFIDVDGNSKYDSIIDKNYNSKKICNGLDGTASFGGSSAVIIATTLSSGDTNCRNGGTKFETFTDLNGNGTYEANVDSYYTVKYTCQWSNSVTIISTVTSGDSTCPSGGTQLTSCIDGNGDSNCTLGPDLNYKTQKICNGAGAGFLVIIENAGANCKSGGYRLDRFQDNNNNSVYDVSIDTGYTSTYICNGFNWLSKTTAFTAGNGTAADNTACASGGVRFEFGYDHVNSSNGAYFVGTDGILDTVEVVATSTNYSCNTNGSGESGAGPLISKFQNDSEGTKARFYWEIVSADGAAPNVKLAYSSTKAGIQAWNCESSLAGVTVISNFSSCTDTTYRTSTSGNLTANAICGFDLTAAPFSMVEWDYRYFKLCAQNSTSPNAQTLTSFRVAGNVPSGMVMVHSDDWPIHEFANTTIVPFTYAIDKWEAYLSSGVITNGAPGVCTDANCVSSSTGVLTSAIGQTPASNIDWFASRKGCANRAAAGYTGVTTPRQIHMQTEMENFIANYGTPDDFYSSFDPTIANQFGQMAGGYEGCNNDLGHKKGDNVFNENEMVSTGSQQTRNCISRYGARDLIGNYGEYLDGYYQNLNSTITRQRSVYWGNADVATTVISDAFLGYTSLDPNISNFVSVLGWDYQNLLASSVTHKQDYVSSMNFFMDVANWDMHAGGGASIQDILGPSGGSDNGRFSKSIGFAVSFTPYWSTRCAIVAP